MQRPVVRHAGALAVAALLAACSDRQLLSPPVIAGLADETGDGIAYIGEHLTLLGVSAEETDVIVSVAGAPALRVGAGEEGDLVVQVPPGIPAGDAEVIATNPGGSSVPAEIVIRRIGYAADFTDRALSVLDVANDGTVTLLGQVEVDVPPGPFGVEISPDGRTAVVSSSIAFLPQSIVDALAPGAPPGDSVVLLDVVSGAVRAVLRTGDASRPVGIAISPDSITAYVTNYTTSTISVIDLAEERIVTDIAVPRQPEEVAVSADGSFLLVGSDGGSASTVDTETLAVLATIETGGNDPSGVALSPDARTGYVVNSFVDATLGEDGTVSVLDLSDPAAPRLAATLADGIGPTPYDVKLTADGNTAVVTNLNVIFEPIMIGPGSISIVNLSDPAAPVARLDVGTAPIYAAIAPFGDFAIAGNGLSQTVSVFDLAPAAVTATVPLDIGIGPADVAIQP